MSTINSVIENMIKTRQEMIKNLKDELQELNNYNLNHIKVYTNEIIELINTLNISIEHLNNIFDTTMIITELHQIPVLPPLRNILPSNSLIIPVKHKNNSSIKMCYNCYVTSTPEWRTGPEGKHTLCNACGLRYAKNMRRFKQLILTPTPY